MNNCLVRSRTLHEWASIYHRGMVENGYSYESDDERPLLTLERVHRQWLNEYGNLGPAGREKTYV
jgi:hypothetical protein